MALRSERAENEKKKKGGGKAGFVDLCNVIKTIGFKGGFSSRIN